MKIKVRYYGLVYDVAGKRVEEINLSDDSQLLDLLRLLVTRYPALDQMIFRSDEYREFLSVSINNVDILSLEGTQTKLNDGDRVLLMPPIGGG